MTNDIKTGIVKFFNADKGYGFFQITDEPDVHFHRKDMELFGFDDDDMKDGVFASFESFVVSDRVRVSVIHTIGDKASNGSAAHHVQPSSPKRKLTRTNDKRKTAESPAKTKDGVIQLCHFVRTWQIAYQARGKHLGKSVHKVLTKTDDFVQYIVVLGNDVIAQLGPVTKAEALATIGYKLPERVTEDA